MFGVNTLWVWFSRHYRLCKFSLALFSYDVCERDVRILQCGYSWRNTRAIIVTWTENVFLSHFMGVGVSYETLAVNPLTVLSPTSGSWCYPTTCASDFLSFSSTAPLSPSLSCPHILLLISIHDHTTSNYFHALFWYFSHLRYPSNYFIPYSVQLGNSAHPS